MTHFRDEILGARLKKMFQFWFVDVDRFQFVPQRRCLHQRVDLSPEKFDGFLVLVCCFKSYWKVPVSDKNEQLWNLLGDVSGVCGVAVVV